MSEDKAKAENPEAGNELFYFDEDGKKQDSAFHAEILANGIDEPGAFDELLESLGLTEAFAATFAEDDD
jgi:hypothetical protein